MYGKLYVQLWTMLITGEGMTYEGNPALLGAMKFLLGIVFILKTPWWLIIKPLGCMFSKLIVSEGLVVAVGDTVVEFDAEKDITYKFLGIPYWFWKSTKFSEDEKLERAGLKD